MSIRRTSKIWSGVSAAALLGTLAACSESAPEEATPVDASVDVSSQSAPEVHGGEGEGEGEGEGGSGGEFGIDPDLARQDPVVYLSALEVIRAHYLAGIDALEAGDRAAGAEMFAHPISEIYVDLEDVVIELGATNFIDEMTEASLAPYDGRSDAEVRAAVERVLASITAAEAFAPQTDQSEARTRALVLSGLVNRAALQYQFAASADATPEAYLDGYGFERAAAEIGDRHLSAIQADDPALAEALSNALQLLRDAYPQAVRPTELRGDADALLDATVAIDAVVKP